MKNQRGSLLVTGIVILLVTFLAVDIGFSLYNPDRLATTPFCTLNIIRGNVTVQTRDTLAWEKARDGMILEPGSRVRTAPDAHASLTFSQGTTTKLEPGTDIIIAKLEGDPDNHKYAVFLKQESGSTWNQVTSGSVEDFRFQIQTSAADIKVHGTLFSTEIDDSGKTIVKTTEGQVSVSAQGQEVLVPAGQQTEVQPDAPPAAPFAIPPARRELVFTINRPAVGLVIDPSGSGAGYRPDGTPLNQISGSRISSPEEPYQTVRIPEPSAGDYSVVLSGDTDTSSSFQVEGFTEGESSFVYTESCNITAANELVLKLHLDVFEGLQHAAAALSLSKPAKASTAVATSLKSDGQKTEATTSEPEPPDTGEKKSVTSEAEKSPLPKATFRLEDTYKDGQWVTAVSIFAVMAIVFAVVLRKL